MKRLRTVVFGFGMIGAGYSADPLMAKYFQYSVHAQVLRGHPAFEWVAVVDPSPEARKAAGSDWSVPLTAARAEDLPADLNPDVLVLAVPPAARSSCLAHFKSVKLVIVEKPLGVDLASAQAFLAECKARGIEVQVNLFRRADQTTRQLADGQMAMKIGSVQAATSLYGNGLHNNAVHMIDLFRMLCGEVATVQALSVPVPLRSCPIPGDVALLFAVTTATGICCTFMPLDFSHYREVGLDLWGEKGRLEILQEGLLTRISPLQPHRALRDTQEIASDKAALLPCSYGTALYEIYDNAAGFMLGKTKLLSPGHSALKNELVVDAALQSAEQGGIRVRLSNVLSNGA